MSGLFGKISIPALEGFPSPGTPRGGWRAIMQAEKIPMKKTVFRCVASGERRAVSFRPAGRDANPGGDTPAVTRAGRGSPTAPVEGANSFTGGAGQTED